MNETVPLHLYHYTSKEALFKIIENNTIKFTRLDHLNDPYEGYISVPSDHGKFGIDNDFMYCSCWTPLADESIAMWRIYNDCKGVRISLPYNMFLSRGSLLLTDVNNCVYPVTPITGIKLDNNHVINRVYGPLPVVYGKDMDEIISKYIARGLVEDPQRENTYFNDIYLMQKAVQKINHWQYENEYRYVISPFIEIHGTDGALGRDHKGVFDFPKELFIPIHRAINEVLLGPEMCVSDEKEIRSVLENHGIINVRKSSVKMSPR